MKNVTIKSFGSDGELAQTAAREWLQLVDAANKRNESHSIALSGGRITKSFFTAVVQQSEATRISLANVHFFWADERCVPPSDPESNFFLAEQLLFQPLGIKAGNIHRLRGELDPETAVRNANEEIAGLIGENGVIDHIFLGMGEDGHVASLFPNGSEEIISCASNFLVVRNSPKPPPTRLSLSYQAIARAKEVWVLASGKGKESALAESLEKNGTTPLARVLQKRANTKIFTDIPLSILN